METKDGTLLQAFINAAVAAGLRHITLPPGRWLMKQALTLPDGTEGVVLDGKSPACVMVYKPDRKQDGRAERCETKKGSVSSSTPCAPEVVARLPDGRATRADAEAVLAFLEDVNDYHNYGIVDDETVACMRRVVAALGGISRKQEREAAREEAQKQRRWGSRAVSLPGPLAGEQARA